MPREGNLPVTPWVRWLALLAGVLMFHCILDDRHAGTSTTTGNTITGVALLADGTAAAGASIRARTDSIVSDPSGAPQCRLIAEATADSLGRFALTVADSSAFYLEIAQGNLGATQQSFLRYYPDRQSRSFDLHPVKLAPPGSASGSIKRGTWSQGDKAWVGIAGTSDFVAVDSVADSVGNHAFRLSGISPGKPNLLVVLKSGVSVSDTGFVAAFVQTDSAGARAIQSGTVTDWGAISVPP